MPEKKIKADFPGVGPVDAFEVGVIESTERWTETQLEDGTVLRVKASVLGAARFDGRYDPDGNPLYALKVSPIMTVLRAPEHLRKGGTGLPKGIQ